MLFFCVVKLFPKSEAYDHSLKTPRKIHKSIGFLLSFLRIGPKFTSNVS